MKHIEEKPTENTEEEKKEKVNTDVEVDVSRLLALNTTLGDEQLLQSKLSLDKLTDEIKVEKPLKKNTFLSLTIEKKINFDALSK